ncbi:MAG TPA: ATP-binding protein [Pedobacter sp.]|jgi:PAS domain S-box-containing protein
MDTVKILLVDDDEDDFVLTKDILREVSNNHNYEVTWCSNFSEAINAMLKSRYDIYLVDYRLGKDSGMDLLNEAIKSNCTEPIIMLTGKGDLKIDREAMQLGAADYLIKDNITAQSLERSIRYAIAHNKTLQELKRSENKFRIIFERSKDPMLITNPQGQIIDANPAALNFFETTFSELTKMHVEALYKKKADRSDYLKQISSQGSVTEFEVEMRTLSGKTKFCSISSFMQVSQHGNEERFYSTIHDLTSRITQEKDAALTAKIAATERFAKSISHEIQNPLSYINLAIDELSNVLNNEEALILADIIKANCEKINALTTELIQSTDSPYLRLVETDLNLLISELLEELLQELEVNIHYVPFEQSVIVKAEAVKLKFALKNILINAVEAVDKANAKVEIGLERHVRGIRINIKDNGPGILPENIDKIFEPFYTTKIKAMGLGLTSAQRIVDTHNGRITVKSEPGTGTIFSVTLPLQHNTS